MNNLNSDSPIIKITRPNLEHLLHISLPNQSMIRDENAKRSVYYNPSNEMVAIHENGRATLLDPVVIEKAREHYEFEKYLALNYLN